MLAICPQVGSVTSSWRLPDEMDGYGGNACQGIHVNVRNFFPSTGHGESVSRSGLESNAEMEHDRIL